MGGTHQWNPAAPSLDEDAWEDLLNFIEERRVIPIVGPELLTIDTADGPVVFYDWVAEKLATRLDQAMIREEIEQEIRRAAPPAGT